MRNTNLHIVTDLPATPKRAARPAGKRCSGKSKAGHRCKNRSARGHQGDFWCHHHADQAPKIVAETNSVSDWMARNSNKLLIAFMVSYFFGPAVVAAALAFWLTGWLMAAGAAFVAGILAMFNTM